MVAANPGYALSAEKREELEGILRYAKPGQRRLIQAVLDHGGQRAAARALGDTSNGNISRAIKVVRERAYKQGYNFSPGLLKATKEAALTPTEVQHGWIKSDGASIFVRPERVEEEQDALERIRDIFEGLSPAPVIEPPAFTESDLLTLYPLADVHMGLQAWGKETGEDYDTDKAAERVKSWVAQCVASSPASETAIVLSTGDLTHADDQTNMTRNSGHILDVDTRDFKTIDITIEAIAAGLECAAAKHEKVIGRIIPGNHDPHAYRAVLFGLTNRYRDNPRIKVQKVPGEWFVRQHGKVMLAAHHGDKSKADRMVHFIADQYAELWGKTRHRFLFTGHLHHHKSADIGGVQWEQLRAVTARDAYAVSHAYTARAQLQAITFHREHGEVSRVKVNGV